mmetsp:Transcript_36740/g.114702  ORF Transcript_36740/g.114702 Transcript_36740/m.114702 type:complete len:470 (-) Transcript_36740:1828-3237(-)
MAQALELAEPNVIDEELIRNCITTVEEISISEDKKREFKQETALEDIQALTFSFQNILKIDNLHGLLSLVKLQLDNNIIEKIENISHLTNLEWLDLSFNNIGTIEGLESLIKLTDLSLFNNRIERLKNLQTLTNLNCLSIGNNQITDVVNAIHYLRPFPNLRILNMQGNPCSKDPEYHMRIIAHLKDIVYVDYRLVDPDQVQSAREHFQDELFEVYEEEKRKAEEMQKVEELHQRQQQLKDANLEGINTLLDEMLKDDTEQEKLKNLTFWPEVIDELQHEFRLLSEEFIENTIKENVKKENERSVFENALNRNREEKDEASISLVHKFNLKKKHLIRQLEEDNIREEEAVAYLKELQESNLELNDDLLEIELRQMEDDDQILSDFERRYGDLVNKFVESAQNEFFSKARELENNFYQNSLRMIQEELEHFAAGQLDELTPEAAMVLGDKELILASMNTSHDIHLGKIDG